MKRRFDKKRVYKDKKAALEVQFNWVFVMIAGAVILTFFFSFIQKQKGFSEGKLTASILTDIETITTGAEVSRGTSQIITVPDLDIQFKATEDCLRYFMIGESSRQLQEQYIFAPTRLEGRQIVSWTLDFSQPYRTANIVFFTSPFVYYYIISGEGDNLAEEINSSLPEGMVYEWINVSSELDAYNFVDSVDDLNYYKVRFIFIGMDPPSLTPDGLDRLNDMDLTALSIKNPGPGSNYYDVEFFKKGQYDNFEFLNSSYAVKLQNSDLESVYAAIFAEDPQLFNCNMRGIFGKVELVTYVYHNRTYDLYVYENSTDPLSNCVGPYRTSAAFLKTMHREALDMSTNFPKDPTTYADNAFELGRQNLRLQQSSCVEIY